MARRTDVVHFLRTDPAELLGVLEQLDRDRDGWVNLQAVEADEESPDAQPARAGLFALVSGRGPRIPVGTWVPAERGGRRRDPDSVGLQHPGGVRAYQQLLAAGVVPPAGATVLSDHPRRGLVLALPEGAAPADVLAWILAASDTLAGRRLPDTWVALVHRR